MNDETLSMGIESNPSGKNQNGLRDSNRKKDFQPGPFTGHQTDLL